MSHAPIVTFTANPTVDKNTSLDQVVAERKLRCDAPDFEPGGGGINVARAIQKMGGAATALFFAGGNAGKRLTALLSAEELSIEAIAIEGETRENFIAFERVSKLQYRFGMPGPHVSDAEGERCIERIRAHVADGTFVVVSGSLPTGLGSGFLAEIAREVKKAKGRIIVDTSGGALKAMSEEGAYLLKCNLSELREVAGEAIDDEAELRREACRLVSCGKTQVVVVSLGAGGAMLASADGIRTFRSPTVPIRSKVGAGDSMVGGITLALARGWDVVRATRHGIAAGAAAVMTAGTELCRGEDVARLFGELEHRDQDGFALPLSEME